MSLLWEGKDHTFINPYSYKVLCDCNLERIVGDRFEVGLDGVSLVAVHNLIGLNTVQRQSFDDTSLAPSVFHWAEEHKLDVGLIGGEPSVITGAAIFFKKKYPNLKISYVRDGFYEPEDEFDVIQKASNCDLVVCSMGTPRQENFLLALRGIGWHGTGFTCGGYFEQLVEAGGGDYYPKYVDVFHLRWIYRLVKEPKRLWRRYFLDYPVGLAKYFMSQLAIRKSSRLK